MDRRDENFTKRKRTREQGYVALLSLFFVFSFRASAGAQLEFSIQLAASSVQVDDTTPTKVEVWVKSSSLEKAKIVDMKWSIDLDLLKVVDSQGVELSSLSRIRDGSTGVKDYVLLNQVDPSSNTMSYSLAFQDANANFTTQDTDFLYAQFYVLPKASGKISFAFDRAFSGALIDDGAGGSKEATMTFTEPTFFVVPRAKMNALSAEQTNTTFFVSWSAESSLSQSIQCFDVQVSEDQTTWTSSWKEDPSNAAVDHSCVISQRAAFSGTAGKTYYFRVRAVDLYGNKESFPSAAEVQTTIVPFYIQIAPSPSRPECVLLYVHATSAQSATPSVSVSQGSSNTSVSFENSAGDTYAGSYCLTQSSGQATVSVNSGAATRTFDVVSLNPQKQKHWQGGQAALTFPKGKGTVAVWEDEGRISTSAFTLSQPVEIHLARSLSAQHYVGIQSKAGIQPLAKSKGAFQTEKGGVLAILKDISEPKIQLSSATSEELVFQLQDTGSGVDREKLAVQVDGKTMPFSFDRERLVIRASFAEPKLKVNISGADRAGNLFRYSEKISLGKAKLLESILLLPNPATGTRAVLKVKTKGATELRCRFFTARGKSVKELRFLASKEKEKALATEFVPGVYFVRCRDENGFAESFKWVVLR